VDKRFGNNPVTVDFKQVTNFPWNKVYFGPYTIAEKVNKQLGLTWSNAHAIEMSDSFNLIVFVKGDKVVRYVELPRQYGDFDVLHKNEYSSDEAACIESFFSHLKTEKLYLEKPTDMAHARKLIAEYIE
jgi:hypothetical protein